MMAPRPTPWKILAVLLALCASALALTPAAGAAGSRAAPPLANPTLLAGFTASERALLARNGFVVTGPVQSRDSRYLNEQSVWFNQDPRHQVYWQFYDLYYENYRSGIPNFITTDAVLHTFHIMYDKTLIALERTIFVPKLQQLSSQLMSVATYQYGATKDARIKEAARLNLGYMAVAQALLDPHAAISALVAQPVRQELVLIAAHKGLALSPLFGYAVDYSRFIPRGHYASDETLRRYFRAMTWFGMLTFHLNSPDGALRTRQALLLTRAFAQIPTLFQLWSAIFNPITAWVGRSDDLTIPQYEGVMARVYPANAPVSVLADDQRLSHFIALANALPNPHIIDELVPSSKGAASATKGLRLFGQRFVPDASIMQNLIFDKVGTPRQPRRWPLGLDVAATLGSSRATALLTGPLHQNRFAHYTQQLAGLQKTYSSLSLDSWQQNLYWSWLNTLRAEWGPVAPLAPAFMKTTAWADKSVATGLGSWSELRHDTILYVKQPLGLGAGGGQTPPQVAYVEPAPLVYTRLLYLTQQLKQTLINENILDSLPQWRGSPFSAQDTPYFMPALPRGERGYRAALDGFAGLIALVERASERELLRQPLSHDDMQALINVAGDLSSLTMFFDNNAMQTYPTPFDEQVAEVADVFTEPLSGQVLEEGVGDVLPLYAIVSIDGKQWLTRGGVYSYYEFHWPMSDRLTDSAWRGMATRPAQPGWMNSFIAH